MTHDNINNKPLCPDCHNVKVKECNNCHGVGIKEGPYDCDECGATGTWREYPWREVRGYGETEEDYQTWWLGAWSAENGCEGVGLFIFKREVFIESGDDRFGWWVHCVRLADCGYDAGAWDWTDDIGLSGSFSEAETLIRRIKKEDIVGAIQNNTDDGEGDTRTLFGILFGDKPTESDSNEEAGA